MDLKKQDHFWQKVIIGLSLLFFLQVVAPFSKPGLYLGHDSQLHLIYLKHFEEAFRAGQIPVRVIDWFVPGFNQPLFNYYQPGVNYFFLIPRFMGFTLTASLELLVVTLWLLSGALMFLFAKRHFGTLPAILVAYMYVIAPYHILDVLIRSALPEFTALAFIPGLFWATKSYFDTRRGFYLTLVSVFIALVTISHPPTIIMFSPIIVLYVLYLIYSQKSLSILLPLITSAIVGFGLISFFLVPALLEQQYVRTIYMRTGYYDFHHHFVCPIQLFKPYWAHGTSQTGCDDRLSFQLGVIHWLVVATALLIVLFKKFSKKKLPFSNLIALENIDSKKTVFLAFCLGLILFYVYMMLEISETVWEFLPYIPFIQYSWRFLAPTIFVSSLCAGFVLLIFKKESFKYGAFVILMLATGLAYKNYLKPIAYAEDEEKINFGNEILKETETGIKALTPEPGYMPRWTYILPDENDRPASEIKVATEEAKLQNYKLTPAHKTYEITVDKPTVAHFYTHYFPGWQVTVDGKLTEPFYDNIYGYMDVPLATGNHQVTLTLKNTPTRTFSNILSLNFAIVAIGLAFVFKKK